jgi:hypothetical protein
MTRSATTKLALLSTLATLAVPMSVTGCKQQVLCPALDSCGGDFPVGDWTLDPGHPSCSEELYTPPADPRLVNADLPAARTPPPEPALYDWCDLLVAGSGVKVPDDDLVVKPPNFFAESPPIGAATIHYDTNRHYVMSTTRTGTFILDFPAYCMRAFGAVDTALDPAAAPGSTGTVCDKLQASIRAVAPAKVHNFTCQLDPNDPAGQQGCLCQYDLSDRQESAGYVEPPVDSTMLHLPGNNFPENATYCVQGNQLQLTGTDGQYLFDRLGLRTLDLVKATVNCTDHMKGPGEDGVDCGPACPILCSAINCTDAMTGPGEDGIDCGPNCPLPCP